MNILLIDDEKSQVDMLAGFLKKQGYSVLATTLPQEAINIVKTNHIHLVISDFKMPDISGEELLKRLKQINPEILFIMITAYGSIETAVNVMKKGAVDFIEKPINLEKLIDKIRHLEESFFLNKTIKEIKETIDIDIPFKNPVILQIYKTIYKIAPKDINIFITGESGTGKEVIAKTIHKLSNRAQAPFIAVNCAAIPENLFESELFGHEKGSFTGAISSKKGKFELANKGTIFLDEIGEMPLHLQGKLLRVLQEKKIERVGSEKTIPLNIRIITATNRDIKEMVANGNFREDLYYRLNVISLELPPLRERREDIPIFIDYFIKQFSNEPITITDKAKDLLIKYHYPGNIRELENIIQRAIALCSNNTITEDDLPDNVRLQEFIGTDFSGKINLNKEIEALEKKLILEALRKHNFNKSQAAKYLGINERVIRYKIDKYKLIKE